MPKETNNGLFQEYGSGEGYLEWKRDYGRLQIAINQVGPDHLPCTQAPDFFFPTSAETDLAVMAVKLCNQCPIKQICAEYAIKHERNGIWGGLNPTQRKAARRTLKRNGNL